AISSISSFILSARALLWTWRTNSLRCNAKNKRDESSMVWAAPPTKRFDNEIGVTQPLIVAVPDGIFKATSVSFVCAVMMAPVSPNHNPSQLRQMEDAAVNVKADR